MNEMERFGALVKRAREAKGMTQNDLAQVMGRPHTFFVRIENAKNTNPPDPQTLRDLGRVLGLSVRSQLEALGYLDPEEMEPGVAYVVREDDPRARLLALLDGLGPRDLEMVIALVGLVSTHAGDSAARGAEVASESIAENGDDPQYG